MKIIKIFTHFDRIDYIHALPEIIRTISKSWFIFIVKGTRSVLLNYLRNLKDSLQEVFPLILQIIPEYYSFTLLKNHFYVPYHELRNQNYLIQNILYIRASKLSTSKPKKPKLLINCDIASLAWNYGSYNSPFMKRWL